MKGLVLIGTIILLASTPKFTLSQNASSSEIVSGQNKSTLKCSIFVPHAFTPNGDGINDALRVNCPCEITEYTFTIYDEKGAIYKTHNIRQKWDGRRNGQPVNEGYYKWEIVYSMKENGKLRERTLHGDIAIIR